MDHAVVIAGAGPTGLMLAAELRLAAVDVVVVEPRTTTAVDGSRAGGLHARTLEVLDQRGIVDRFLAAGEIAQVQMLGGVRFDLTGFPTRFPHGLALWQRRFEPMLAEWVETELGVRVRRGEEVVGFTQDGAGVDVEVAGGPSVRAQYLVGCDGGRSRIRRATGIEFAGLDATTSWLIAEVDLADGPEPRVRPEGGGVGPAGDGSFRVVLADPEVVADAEPDLADVRAALVRTFGTDFGLRGATWISRFTDVTRQAVTYRAGRVLLAGDAAHVHPPQGGQGMNVGLQDAVNLGWKLAQVVAGASPASLLDTYTDERHPVGARVQEMSRAVIALTTPDPRHESLRAVVGRMLATDETSRGYAAMLAGLDVHYDLGGAHPLVGRRMPDLDLVTSGGPSRVFTMLHDARPVLLHLGAPTFDVSAWPRVRVVRATTAGPWELPVLGTVPAPDAVLIRPDGHVAWAGDPSDPELPRALGRWFGAG